MCLFIFSIFLYKNCYRFGEADHFQERVFIFYDGVHYDPVVYDQPHDKDITNHVRTKFSTILDDEVTIMAEALELGMKAFKERAEKQRKVYTFACCIHDLMYMCHAAHAHVYCFNCNSIIPVMGTHATIMSLSWIVYLNNMQHAA